MIWPQDLEAAHALWRASQVDAGSLPLWRDLPEDAKRIATAMFQAGMHEAASMADTWGDPPLRDQIKHHAVIGPPAPVT